MAEHPNVPNINDETTIVLKGCGPKYYYKWSQIKTYPQFWVTKRILTNGEINIAGYRRSTCHPVVYSYIHLYILCGEKIKLAHIANELDCSPEAVLAMIKTTGFGEEIIDNSLVKTAL